MSRAVDAKASVTISAEERAERITDQGKLLLTKYKGHDCAVLLKNDRLRAASFFHANASRAQAAIGAIYIGKVKNVVKNIDACFVEIANGELCFLPMKNASAPYLVNRAFDGRLPILNQRILWRWRAKATWSAFRSFLSAAGRTAVMCRIFPNRRKARKTERF